VVDAVDDDARQSTAVVRCQLDVGDEGDEAFRIIDADAALLGQPRQGPVQQARIAEPVADLDRGGSADAALARGSRPVEGHDESHRVEG
jgi:hypothetical protein